MYRFFIFYLLLTVSISFAQVKFGKVSKEELKQDKSSLEVEAPAEILFKEGYIEIAYNPGAESYVATKTVTSRIKIYDKEKAPSYLMNLNIPAYKIGSTMEKVSNIQATTYNLVDDKIEKTKLKNKDIFTEEVSKYLKVEKFAFPNIQDGSILEYKYTLSSPRFYDLDTWYIQTELPVKYNRLIISYPEFFVYQKDRRGELLNPINTKRKRYDDTNYNVDELVYENVPSLKREPFVQNLNNLKTSIRYELKEYNNPGYGYKNLSSTWTRIVKDLYNSESYGKALNGNRFLDDDVAQFTEITDMNERTKAIFEFVQSNYTWNNYLNLYPMEGIRKTYKEKTGNGTDLNFILISMLRKADIDANPIILSTVNNGMLNMFPTKQKLNHTITAVLINDKLHVMDPADKYSKIDMLPERDLNLVGFLIQGDGIYQKVDLMNHLVSEIKTVLKYTLDDDILRGSHSKTKTNYFAMSDLSNKADDESNFETNYISSVGADIYEFNFRSNKNNDAIRYQLKFEDEKNLEEIGNKLLLKPLLFEALGEASFNFTNKERKYPLEFGTPFTATCIAEFTIPPGYEVESMPEDENIILPKKVGGYTIKFQNIDNKIVAYSLLHIGYSLLPPTYYNDIKNMFEKIIEVENKQIILRKN